MSCPAYTLHHTQCHFAWDRAQPPVLTVAPGDTITLDIRDASAGQITPASGPDVFAAYDSARVNPVTGPIYVDGAQPGDTLTVALDHFAPSGWGWTAIIPGFGLLSDQFREAALTHWHYDETGLTPLLFGDAARVPLAPFTGTVGVAPASLGPHAIIPPRHVGGNMDIRDLVAGSVLHLPVEVPGALLSIGDTHAAQGDGEVCGTAIESPMQVTVTVGLVKGQHLAMPIIDRPAIRGGPAQHGRVWITTGIGPRLHEASCAAVGSMIDLLGRETALAAADAYMLCSVAGDLRIAQLVDAPNWTVTFHMPQAIFH